MNRQILIIVISLFPVFAAYGQALRDINYRYLYSAESPVDFLLKTVRVKGGWKIFYQATVRDSAMATQYRIEWEGREALASKESATINSLDSTTAAKLKGEFTITESVAPKIIVAKVINSQAKRAWLYYRVLESNYSINLYADPAENGNNFIRTGESRAIVRQDSSKTLFVSYYTDKFPAAAPAFSETLGRVAQGIIPDSSLRLAPAESFRFFANGLYLFQTDTAVAEGYSIRAESDYPRYSLVQNLAAPFIYICTKGEFDRLEAAKGDKKTFDRTVLTIAGDAERAKRLIKNYFRRVEFANHYFTSYKEGWKTDRGMIYVIFGPPDEVYRFYDREVWNYDNSEFKANFEFVKSSSVFDPDNYVLIRDKKYREVWYQVVDLWRNARF